MEAGQDGLASQQYYDNSFDVGCNQRGDTEKTSVHDKATETGARPGHAQFRAASCVSDGIWTLAEDKQQ